MTALKIFKVIGLACKWAGKYSVVPFSVNIKRPGPIEIVKLSQWKNYSMKLSSSFFNFCSFYFGLRLLFYIHSGINQTDFIPLIICLYLFTMSSLLSYLSYIISFKYKVTVQLLNYLISIERHIEGKTKLKVNVKCSLRLEFAKKQKSF